MSFHQSRHVANESIVPLKRMRYGEFLRISKKSVVEVYKLLLSLVGTTFVQSSYINKCHPSSQYGFPQPFQVNVRSEALEGLQFRSLFFCDVASRHWVINA